MRSVVGILLLGMVCLCIYSTIPENSTSIQESYSNEMYECECPIEEQTWWEFRDSRFEERRWWSKFQLDEERMLDVLPHDSLTWLYMNMWKKEREI